jgi:hypothetical protein
MNTFTLKLKLDLVGTKYFYILYLVFWLPNILHMAANIYCFVMVAIYNNKFCGHQTSMWLKNLKNTVTEDTKIESFVVLVNIYFQTF